MPPTRHLRNGSDSGNFIARPRNTQPRRKLSQGRRLERGDSQDVGIVSSQSPVDVHFRDSMDIDDVSDFAYQHTQQAIFPLQKLADRVGREVELFAEKLDTWTVKKSRITPTSGKDSGLGLVAEYSTFANETVSLLSQRHKVDRSRDLRLSYARRKYLRPNTLVSSIHPDDGLEDDIGQPTTLADLTAWHIELDTWRLFDDFLESKFTPPQEMFQSHGYDRFAGDGHTWTDFLEQHDVSAKRLLIMKWLEESAGRIGGDLDILQMQLESESGSGKGLWSRGWLNTRERIKGERRLRLWNTSNDSGLGEIKSSDGSLDLVTQLDPDAVTRQHRNLENADQDFELSFWIMLWEMLRRGKPMDEISEWCREHNQYAMAFMVGAHSLSVDGQAVSTSINARYRWRKACIHSAYRTSQNPYERAVFGVLGGDQKFVDSICTSWEDLLYSHLNAHLLSDYKQFLLQSYPSTLPPKQLYSFGELPAITQNSWESTSDFLSSLQSNTSLQLNAQNPLKMIQASLISQDIEQLIVKQGIGLARKAQKTPPAISQLITTAVADLAPTNEEIESLVEDHDALRVLAHIYLILKMAYSDFGSNDNAAAAENVLVAYIQFLLLAGKMQLLPAYCAQLNAEAASPTMARILPAITDPGQRMHYVKLMESCDMDVNDVLLNQYEFALEYSPLLKAGTDSFRGLKILASVDDTRWPGKRIRLERNKPLEEEEKTIVHSMEWYLLVEGYWQETFQTLTDIAERLLLGGRVHAVLELLQKLSPSQVSRRKCHHVLPNQVVDIMEDNEEINDESQLALRQVLQAQCKVYYDIGHLTRALRTLWEYRRAEDSYTTSQGTAQNEGKAAYANTLSQLRESMDPLLQKDFLTRSALGSVPNDTQTAYDLESGQLCTIREAYLPEMLIAYVSALHAGGGFVSRELLLDALELAVEIARNDELVRCFVVKKRTAELADVFARVNRTLLRINEGSSHTRARDRRTGRTMALWDVPTNL